MTIVENRHHAVIPFLVSDGRGGGGEGARGEYSFSIFWNATLENGKKDIESGKCLRRRRNENVFNDISPFF